MAFLPLRAASAYLGSIGGDGIANVGDWDGRGTISVGRLRRLKRACCCCGYGYGYGFGGCGPACWVREKLEGFSRVRGRRAVSRGRCVCG